MNPIKLAYSEQLIRQVMRSFWKQKVGFVLPLITVMMIVMFDRPPLMYTINLGSYIAIQIVQAIDNY